MKSRTDPDAEREFAELAGECLSRFLRQNGRPALSGALPGKFLVRLWVVANDAGFPPPLGENELGEPGEISAELTAGLVAQVFAGLPFPEYHPDLEVPARQLLKACLNPEFRRCRESYKEVVDGVCRRQELVKAVARISGAHCVDCPYWTSLRPAQHVALLEREWVAGGAENFRAHREVFLPEDFRALRAFLRRHARAA